MSLFGGGDKPKPPPPPPPPPTETDPAVQAEAAKAAELQRKRRGRSATRYASTLLSSGYRGEGLGTGGSLGGGTGERTRTVSV